MLAQGLILGVAWNKEEFGARVPWEARIGDRWTLGVMKSRRK